MKDVSAEIESAHLAIRCRRPTALLEKSLHVATFGSGRQCVVLLTSLGFRNWRKLRRSFRVALE